MIINWYRTEKSYILTRIIVLMANLYHIFAHSPNSGWTYSMCESLSGMFPYKGTRFGSWHDVPCGKQWSIYHLFTIVSPAPPNNHKADAQFGKSLVKRYIISHGIIKNVIRATQESTGLWEFRRGGSHWFGMGTSSWNRELSRQGEAWLQEEAGIQGQRENVTQSTEANHTGHTRPVLIQQHFLFLNSQALKFQTDLQTQCLTDWVQT